jgi:hypothetical protein
VTAASVFTGWGITKGEATPMKNDKNNDNEIETLSAEELATVCGGHGHKHRHKHKSSGDQHKNVGT